MPRALRTFFLSVLILPLTSSLLLGGEVQLAWDPSETATGYTVYRGTDAGSLGDPLAVGNQTQVGVDDLADCTLWHFAVTASNVTGESEYSTQVSTWPRAVLQSALPAVVEQGQQVALVVDGVNFRDGDVVTVSNPGITLEGVTLNSCQQLVLTLSVAAAAATGPVNVTVEHPSGVAGSGNALFTVSPPAPPTVLATSPLNGASDVSLTVTPTVQFSEAVGGVNSSNVRLLDAQGSPVAQAEGSPSLSPDGTVATITPAAELAHGSVYRIHVVGGVAGVVDEDGNHPAEDYLQPDGFTTVGDEAGPQVSELQVVEIDGTSAVVSWTTDEPATSSVSWRKQGNTLWQSVESGGETTAHALQVTGLEPQTTYEFHVSSTDGSGNTTTTEDDTFQTTESPYHYLRFEAEGAALTAPVEDGAGAGAFGGGWIGTPDGLGQGTAGDPNGTALHGVNLPTGGVWYLWVRMYAPDGASNSWFESIDGSDRVVLSTDTHDAWVWVAGSAYELEAGLHGVELAGREDETLADRLLLTNDPDFVPGEQPDVDQSPPAAVASFEAAQLAQTIQLSWTNPAAGDLESVVVRYRTDGAHPTSPVDGFALVDGPATPGADDGHAHAEVEGGVTYHYSAFALDEAGNVSAAAHAEGSVLSVPPPPQNVRVY
jgi:hypothetical protein